MSKRKFPNLIHVIRSDDDEYWQVEEAGVADVDQEGTPMAIYKLVSVGTVTIRKSFTEKSKPSGHLSHLR